jgi:hypothetical protein
MSLFDDASLIVTPNGQKAGKLYSIKPTDGSGDLSVTRATSATRVDANGLVEIPIANLVLRSEEFDNASWTKTVGVVVTANSQISPNGTLTADTINFGASNRIVSQNTSLPIGVVATGSIYVKGTSGETIQMAVGGVDVLFTLNGEWQRLEGTRTSIANNINLNTFGGATARIISVWGAQFEQGVSATEYIPTVASIRTKFAGITQDGSSASNIPRLDYSNSSCPSILVEPQRTNLITFSEQFDNAAWTKANATITANSIISPSGIQNADTYNVTSTFANIIYQSLTFTTGNYSISVYAKKGTSNIIRLFNVSSGTSSAWFDLNLGQVVGTVNGGTASIENVGNGWYRCIYKGTSLISGFVGIGLSDTANTTTATIGSSVYLWGAQLEAGSNATSYIPTTSASVTRNADVISKTGISSLIGQNEGTLFVDFNYTKATDVYRRIFAISDNTSNNLISINLTATGSAEIYIINGGVTQVAFVANILTLNTRYKIAVGYIANNAVLYINGILRNTDLSCTIPTCSGVYLGKVETSGSTAFLNDTINTAMLFKTKLTNSELATLTTL